jgi:xanthine dehydrogenase accessory factor
MQPAESTQDIFETAARWQAEGKGVALASVVATWGSSPRPIGSYLVADESGNFQGSVSGGCVEGAVIGEARAAIKDRKPRLLSFGITNEQAWEVGLACGGKVEIFVSALDGRQPSVASVLDAARDKQPIALVTDLASGAQAMVSESGANGALTLSEPVCAAAVTALAAERSATVEDGGRRFFINVLSPPRRLAVVGAVHIAQQLVPMAAMAGYDVTVIDPRSSFASDARFPGVKLVSEWPDAALADFAPDRRSAVVTLTHDPKLDDPALAAALRSNCFFIGALGSRKTHASRLARLKEQGFSETELARINGPVGLAIGAVSPAEIAISILAQMTEVLHVGGKTGSGKVAAISPAGADTPA